MAKYLPHILLVLISTTLVWSLATEGKAESILRRETLQASDSESWEQELDAEFEDELKADLEDDLGIDIKDGLGQEENDLAENSQKGEVGQGDAPAPDPGSCLQEYSRVMDENGAEFADCYGKIEDPGCSRAGASGVNKPVNLLLIVDASGSMAARIKGESRMSIAQNAAKSFLHGLKQDVNLALMVYGHKGSNKPEGKELSCAGIETLFPLRKLNVKGAVTAINSLKPVGYTPLAASLDAADSMLVDFPAEKYRNVVILISDGKETCGGNPVSSAKSLNSNIGHSVINVIGLDVGGEVEAQLHAIANAGEGQYYSARTPAEMDTVLANLARQECAIDQNEKALEARLSVELNMMECKNRLVFEKNAVMLEVGLVQDSGCRQIMTENYRDRYFSVKDRLGEIYRRGLESTREVFGDSDEAAEYELFFKNNLQDFEPIN